ncbi:hypothetical protein ABF87_14010 [Nitrosomonas sp. JL21]|uniref:hypothetical protein n=1 Tax=Nitrosomonas sp. JL21 TaxID=153949 RepID=UPI001370668E|nr:hypothetical protein [Nitrosomonas sp. JL21]MBL8498632.1 hypothetical protein [Nitrosomonas sp.]MCC7091505.1 hypothetical protein [Nitrosomonas sp.]MXS79053.1 hypothetical protein [Nitrosomonas sp. JL21]
MEKTVFALLIAGAFSTSVHAVSDTFNRPALGSDWMIQSGNFHGNGATVSGTDQALMTFAPGNHATSVSLDISFDGIGTEYGAIVLGYAGTDENAFIKIQSQNGHGALESAAFYYGNNGDGNFFCLPSDFHQFSSAHITGTLEGSRAALTIETGDISQTFTWDYGGVTFGSGVGVGVYGAAQLDNFIASSVPELDMNAMLLAGLGLVGWMANRKNVL